MSAKLAMSVLVLCGFCASAAVVGVSDSHRITVASGDTVSPQTTAVCDTLPDVGSRPIFHLDASQTNGWTFGENGMSVTKIPSLIGERYLYVKPGSSITGMSVKNSDGTMWNNNDYWTVDAPMLEENALNSMSVLDFGPMGARRGLLFDRQGDGEEGSTTNQLRGIGTVIAVWDSSQGGGTLLAGGVGNNGRGVGYGRMWARGAPFTYCGVRMDNGKVDSSGNGYVTTFEKWSPVLWCAGARSRNDPTGCAYIPAVNGVLRLNGAKMIPWLCGFNGGWETVSIVATDAEAVANGVGFGVMTQNKGNLSGGMKIAELIIYPDNLSVFDVARVEEYLAAKWLGRVPYGKGGRARAGDISIPSAKSKDGSSLTVEVPAGAVLKARTLDYGRGRDASLSKTGAGTLELDDSEAFSGTVKVSQGTLRIPARSIPNAVPSEPFFVIDASRIDTYQEYIRTEGGTNFVDRADSAVAVDYHRSSPSPLCASRDGYGRVPFLVENVFPSVNGISAPAFDFWQTRPNGNSSNKGGYWRLAYSEDPATLRVRGVTTVIAVVNPRFVGGTLLGGIGSAAADGENMTECYFERCQQNTNEGTARLASWRSPLLGVEPFKVVHDTLVPTNGMTMIDGVVRDPADGFASPGWQVVAIQVPGSCVECIGTTYNGDYAGGFMLAELALYNHALTEDEMRDASAYMAAKWLNRRLSGYERTEAESEKYSVQRLEVSENAAVEVPAGKTARIGRLSASGRIVVKGGGTLEVEDLNLAEGFESRDGSRVKLVKKVESDALAEMARGESLHLDANDSSSMITYREGNVVYVRSWADRAKRNIAMANGNLNVQVSGSCPYLTDGQVFSAESGRFVNFGGHKSGKWMNLLKPLHNVRVAYILRVSTTESGNRGLAGGVLLGENGDYSDSFDFLCAGNNNGHLARPFAMEAHSVTTLEGFAVYTNGVKIASPAKHFYSPDNEGIPPKVPVLYELHLPAPAHVSALAGAKNSVDYSGNQAIGEVILYERELSEREKIQTRNYLMRKWFLKSDAELSELPPKAESESGDLEVSDGLVVGGGGVRRLTGGGTVEKIGDETLSVEDFNSFTGTVAVKEGTLKLVKPIPSAEPALPAKDRIIARFDASVGVELNASSQVLSWTCAEGGGWSVAPSDSNMAVYESADALNGRGVVNIPKNQHVKMRFKNPSGEFANIEKIGSVLWLIGSQQGGGFLLGGGSGRDNFHRGATSGTTSYGDNYTDPLLYSGAADAVRTAEFYLNGERVANPMAQGLSGGWDIVTMRRTDNYPGGVTAGGLAWCQTVSDRNGSQKVAEIVIYEGRISEAERDAGMFYLRTKWGLDGEFQSSISNRLSVTLSAEASLDMNGGDQYLDSLGGEGSIVNGGSLCVGSLIADFSSSVPLAYGGKLVVRPGFSINLNLSEVADATGFLPLMTVSGVDGIENLRNVQFIGDVEMLEKYRIKPKVVGGVLGINVAARALSIIVR